MSEHIRDEETDGSSDQARRSQKQFYDARFKGKYMASFDDKGLSREGNDAVDVFASCRRQTVRDSLNRLRAAGFKPSSILDYGGGQGRYIPVWREAFPGADITLADISDFAVATANQDYPDVRCVAMDDEEVPLPDASFDMVVSVEVLEHVADVTKATREFGRLLKPEGIVLITTPCANPGSAEWMINQIRRGIQTTSDGFVRFATDEPGHLRRLTDDDLGKLLEAGGIQVVRVDHRAQVLATALVWVPLVRRLPVRWRAKVAYFEWLLCKRLPNGATMVAIGRKADKPEMLGSSLSASRR